MKLLKILIIIALILFPFGELLRFSLGNNIVIKPLDLTVLLTAFLWGIRAIITKKLPKNSITIPVLMFSAVALLSLLINLSWLQRNEMFASALYLIRWISYAILFFVVSGFDTKFKKKIISFLLVDGAIIVVLGYLQYLFYPSMKSLYSLGWDEHMYRLFSVFLDPNFAGAFFVFYLLFVGGLLYRALQEKQKRKSQFLSLLLFLTLGAVFFTYSRSAYLMVIISSIVFLFLIKQKKILVIFFAIFALFLISISSNFYIENINLFREASSKARIDNYGVAVGITLNKPLFGVGFNTYRYAKSQYGIQQGWTNAPSHADAGVDNSFLFVLATTGSMGLLAYCWLWIQILKSSLHSFNKKKYIFGAVFFAGSIGLFLNASFINSLFFPALLFWIWILFGVMEA